MECGRNIHEEKIAIHKLTINQQIILLVARACLESFLLFVVQNQIFLDSSRLFLENILQRSVRSSEDAKTDNLAESVRKKKKSNLIK